MDTQHEETHEVQQNKDIKSLQIFQQEVRTVNEQQNSMHEEKFTWNAGDLVHYKCSEDIPGYTPFPGVEKKRRKIPWPYPSRDTE